MAEPRTATLTGTVSWSGGELFDGFVLIGLAQPSNSEGDYTVTLDAAAMRQRIPIWTKIKIKDGVFDTAAKLYWNADIEPPNTKYAAYFYANPRKRVAPLSPSTPSLFTVASTEYAITVPTLTDPVASVSAPVPNDA